MQEVVSGYFVNSSTNSRQFCVLEEESLTVFDDNSECISKGIFRERLHISYAASFTMLLPSTIHLHAVEKSLSMELPTPRETLNWQQNFQVAISNAKKKQGMRLGVLMRGNEGFKYNSRNGKRVKRFFWLSDNKENLCWARSRKRRCSKVSLVNATRLEYGVCLGKDPDYLSIRIVTIERVISFVMDESVLADWYLGLQWLMMVSSEYWSYQEFVHIKTEMKALGLNGGKHRAISLMSDGTERDGKWCNISSQNSPRNFLSYITTPTPCIKEENTVIIHELKNRLSELEKAQEHYVQKIEDKEEEINSLKECIANSLERDRHSDEIIEHLDFSVVNQEFTKLAIENAALKKQISIIKDRSILMPESSYFNIDLSKQLETIQLAQNEMRRDLEDLKGSLKESKRLKQLRATAQTLKNEISALKKSALDQIRLIQDNLPLLQDAISSQRNYTEELEQALESVTKENRKLKRERRFYQSFAV